MAYVNVAEWKPEQVTEWLKGLDNAVLSYIHSFLNNEVSGQQLLNLRPDDLDHLGVHKLGHQEIILEAVDHLRNFHYELDRENLQLLALRLSCKAHSLCNELSHTTETPVSTQTLADVAGIITAVKPLVCWLDGSPFSGQLDYRERRGQLLRPSLEIATVAHRDRFAEAPVAALRDFSGRLAREADSIIQEVLDPLVLQPASLDLATLKKRPGDDLGILIVPSFRGVHQIAEIKYSSPAHSCGKIEEGDEVVQVNYQTVVGWQTKQVMALLEECQTDVFLTLKKRPRHTKVYGQIYMKPYRLPSKKRSAQYSRWHDNLPSPRPELLTIPDFEMPLPRAANASKATKAPPPAPLLLLETHSSSSEDDESFLSGGGDGGGDGGSSPTSARLYQPKPRVTVQRRATVTGASPTSKRPPVYVQQLWREIQRDRQWLDSSEGSCGDAPKDQLYQLRDKSVSFGNGFVCPRPSTCLGIETKRSANGLGSHPGKTVKPMEHITENSPVKAKPLESKPLNVQEEELLEILRTQHGLHVGSEGKSESGFVNVGVKSATIDSITVRSVKKDVHFEGTTKRDSLSECDRDKTEADHDSSLERSKERGRLDKSFSTPAYDTSEESTESSPIEKTFPPKTKPKPPRRNRPPKPKEPVENGEDHINVLETINTALIDRRLRDESVVAQETGLPDYHEIANGDLSEEDLARLGTHSMKLSFENKKQYERVEICITPPEPPPRPSLGMDQSRAGPSGSDQSRTGPFGSDQSRAGPSSSDQSRAGPSSSDQSRAGPSSLVQLKGGGVAESSKEAASRVQLTESPTSEKTANKPLEGAKSSPPGGGGVTHRAMQVAKSLGRNVNAKNMFAGGSLPSPRGSRKKNALLAKRRNVSVLELGTGHLDGYLHHRRRAPGTSTATWTRGWFVLRESAFYGFAAPGSVRAQLVIALPGFTSSPAHEVKSRKFAFKVYHTGTVFYFAAETEEELTSWLDAISAATIRQEITNSDTVMFSESDEGSDTEMPTPSPKNRIFGNFLGGYSSSHNADKSPEKRFGSLKKLGRKHEAAPSADASALSLDRKYLRIFSGRGNAVPVPTAQFRSYRRCPHPAAMPAEVPASPSSPGRSQFYLSAESVFHDAGVPESVKKSATFHDVIASTGPPSYETVVKDTAYPMVADKSPDESDPSSTETPTEASGESSPKSPPFRGSNTVSRPVKEKPVPRPRNLEYRERNIHASNPSLVLIPNDMSDYRLAAERLREFGIRRNRQREDTSGFVTLQEFMLSRQEEERRQRGEPASNHAAPPKEAPPSAGPAPAQRKTSLNGGRGKQPDSREYRGGSPEKQWIDSLRRNDANRKPVSTGRAADVNANRLKSATQYQPPPAAVKATANSVSMEERMRPAFEMHLDKNSNPEVPMSKFSKYRALFSGGKTHAANAVSPGVGAKTLLGSPRLHRAIFKERRGGAKGASDSSSSSLSSPASPPFDWPAEGFATAQEQKPTMGVTMLGKKPSRRTQPPSPSPSQSSPPPDYPGLEYPPVFEPETYTLSDASTLMRAKKTN